MDRIHGIKTAEKLRLSALWLRILFNWTEVANFKELMLRVPRDELESETAAYTALITRTSRENLLQTKSKIIQRAKIADAATLDL